MFVLNRIYYYKGKIYHLVRTFYNMKKVNKEILKENGKIIYEKNFNKSNVKSNAKSSISTLFITELEKNGRRIKS